MTLEYERIYQAVMLIDHPVLEWSHYYLVNNCGATWEDFLSAVHQRFDPSYYENYVGLLSKLTQTGSVVDYQSSFEALLKKVVGVPEATLIAMYVSGLKKRIQREVNLRGPTTLPVMFALACELSACHQVSAAFLATMPRRAWSSRTSPGLPSLPSSSGHLPTPPTAPRLSPGSVRPPDKAANPSLAIVCLSATDKAQRNKKGLCWYCDEKWIPGHNCKHRFLVLMGPDDDKDDSVSLEPTPRDGEAALITTDISSVHSLSAEAVEFYEVIPAPSSTMATPEVAPSLPADMPPIIRDVLTSHHMVFGVSASLPPSRGWDHHIHFVDGSRPINVCPYRYPFFHKSEIERQKENATLHDLQGLHAAVQAGLAPTEVISHAGVLYYKRRIYISPTSSLWDQILNEFHSTPMAGHQGVDRTFRRIANVFYWPGLRRVVCAFVASCPSCQATKYFTRKPSGLLQPLRIPERVWDSASMDFVTGLPPSRLLGYHGSIWSQPACALCDHAGPFSGRQRGGLTRERAALLQDIKLYLSKMQQHMRSWANQHRREVSYDVGDLVLLKLQPHCQHSFTRPLSTKLARRFYGPFKVVEQVSPVAYRLQLREGSQIHDVFYVSLLRPFVQQDQLVHSSSLPDVFLKGWPFSVPVAILDQHTVLVDGVALE
ncbi:unnamed protein product [Cuscuta campestris]|uniref:Integrase zinc-binding domain-containing protein n=1 Tax=Cuscuta campestris TaxID=132261 RepID=A0A484MV92_9ASTE|nr:unnamed protein product [Cuscuta campestris]